jgi:hypothetical protein
MTLKDHVQEIVNTWMIIVNEDRELTQEEEDHILNIQKRAIMELKQEDDGLTDEELKAEYYSNKGIDIFGNRNVPNN